MDIDDHDEWLNASRALLADARGDPARIEEAIRQVCASGFSEMRFSPMIVWDYPAVSTPGLFVEAGYTDAEVDALMPVIESVMKSVWTSRDVE
jgi:hypothetical protein